MKTLALGVVSALAFVSAAFAGEPSSGDVRNYKPFGAFNFVVGDTRFSGYFIPGPDRCDVDIKQADAGGETLAVRPRRMTFQIAAAGRNELDAGPDAVLAVACAEDARTLQFAPQNRFSAARN
jgi:hypothetical protein